MIVEVYKSGFKMNDVLIVANDETKTVVFNDERANYNATQFIEEIKEITSSWKPQMIKYGVLDGVWYWVKFVENGEERMFEGRNKFPSNYNEFTNLIEKCKNSIIN